MPRISTGCRCARATGATSPCSPGAGGDYLAPAILPYWMELGHLQETKTNGASVPSGPLPRFFAPQ